MAAAAPARLRVRSPRPTLWERLREVKLHEWATGAYAFVFPLNHGTFFAALKAPFLGLMLVSLIFTIPSMASRRGRTPDGLERTAGLAASAARMVALFAFVMLMLSFRADLPSRRLINLVAFLGLVLAFFVCDHYRPGSFFRIMLVITFLQLVLSLQSGAQSIGAGGTTRLNGATHPDALGFEAGCIVLWFAMEALSYINVRSRRFWLSVGGVAFALYVEFAAFARTSLIGLMLGTPIIIVLRKGGSRVARAIVVAIGIGFVLLFSIAGIKSYLAHGQANVFGSVSGRSQMWHGILSYSDRIAPRGYGYFAMHFLGGPDDYLQRVSGYRTPENSLLEAFVEGGIAGFVVFVLLLVFVGMAYARQAISSNGFLPALFVLMMMSAYTSDGLAGIATSWLWLMAGISACWYFAQRSERERVADRLAYEARVERAAVG